MVRTSHLDDGRLVLARDYGHGEEPATFTNRTQVQRVLDRLLAQDGITGVIHNPAVSVFYVEIPRAEVKSRS